MQIVVAAISIVLWASTTEPSTHAAQPEQGSANDAGDPTKLETSAKEQELRARAATALANRDLPKGRALLSQWLKQASIVPGDGAWAVAQRQPMDSPEVSYTPRELGMPNNARVWVLPARGVPIRVKVVKLQIERSEQEYWEGYASVRWILDTGKIKEPVIAYTFGAPPASWSAAQVPVLSIEETLRLATSVLSGAGLPRASLSHDIRLIAAGGGWVAQASEPEQQENELQSKRKTHWVHVSATGQARLVRSTTETAQVFDELIGIRDLDGVGPEEWVWKYGCGTGFWVSDELGLRSRTIHAEARGTCTC